ncbi:MAG: hypothetical protein GY866_32985 [Proteobacteria bacterium]|nr:hypothetical protein [Pseudomonadota bacterium]
MKRLLIVFILVLAAQFSVVAAEETEFGDEFSDEEEVFEEEAEFDDDPDAAQAATPSFLDQWVSPARITLKHETSYKTATPERVVNNRSSVRLEYERPLGDYFYIRLDTKANGFHGNDHRAEAEDKTLVIDTVTREAYLQASLGNTSLKAGLQILIWGESDGGAITDVISPRDYSELFFISLEESRIGQLMVVLDQYTDLGTFSLFCVPDPKFDALPEAGTEYYVENPVLSAFAIDEPDPDESLMEYGLRWKKTFGKSDVALMAARLVSNQYAYESVLGPGFMPMLEKTARPYRMLGTAFNYSRGNFLWKAEIAAKTKQAFNTLTPLYQLALVEKDVLDAALGFEYSPGGAYTLGVEAGNRQVADWSNSLVDTPENASTLVLAWSKNFLNEDLSLSWMSSHSYPGKDWFHQAEASYNWDDHLTFELQGFYPDLSDEEGQMWSFRDQKRITARVQYQF